MFNADGIAWRYARYSEKSGLALLPTYLPSNGLNQLITDHPSLTSDESEEYTPPDMLTGYYEDSEYGGMPFKNPESNETDPMNRLTAGERLTLQLHLGTIQDEAPLSTARPTAPRQSRSTQTRRTWTRS